MTSLSSLYNEKVISDEHEALSWPLSQKKSWRTVTRDFRKEAGCKLGLEANSYHKEKQQGPIKMPERKITYLGPSYLARNAADAPRRKNRDFAGSRRVPPAKHCSGIDRLTNVCQMISLEEMLRRSNLTSSSRGTLCVWHRS